MKNFIQKISLITSLIILTSAYARANELTIHMARSPHKVNWKSVNGLLISSANNSLGKAPKSTFALGHLVVEVKCDTPNELGINHFMTGMTQKNAKESKKLALWGGLGLGTMIYPFEGTLNPSQEMISSMKTMAELGRYKSFTIPVTAKRCQKMMDFMAGWIANGSYSIYGGGQDVAAGQGSGCAEFAEKFFEIATDQKFPASWVMEKKVPLKLIGSSEDSVSLVRVLLRKKWAKVHENYLLYRMPDITTAMDLIDNGFDVSTLPHNSMIDFDDAKEVFNFKYNYNVSREEQLEMWNRIRLDDSRN